MRVPALAVLGMLPTTALALQTGQPAEPEHAWNLDPLAGVHRIDWPAGFDPGAFRRAASGSFLGNDSPSLFVLRGTSAIYVHEPTAYAGLVDVAPSCYFQDIDTLPTATTGAPDSLVGIGIPGLVRLTHDGSAFVQTLLGTNLWRGGIALWTTDLDGQPGEEIVGLNASGSAALIGGFDPGTGAFGESSFPLVRAADDVVALDWVGGGATAVVAVSGDDALDVYDLSGTLVQTFAADHPGSSLTVLEGIGGLPDRILWSTRSTADDRDLLFLVEAAGIEGPLELMIAPEGTGPPVDLGVVGLATGNADASGGDELLIGHEAFLQAPVLTNLDFQPGATETYELAPGSFELVDLASYPGSSAAGNRAIPAFADLDRDPFRSADVVAPLDNLEQLVVLRGVGERNDLPSIPPLAFVDWTEAGTLPIVDPVDPNEPQPLGYLGPVWEYLDMGSYFEESDQRTVLHLTLNSIPEYLTQNYEYLQVLLWSQSDPITVADVPVDPMAVSHKLHPISTNGAGVRPPHHRVAISIPRTGLLWPDHQHYYVAFRFANATLSGGTPMVQEGASLLLLGLTMPAYENEWTENLEDVPSYAYLENLAVGQEIFLIEGAPPASMPAYNGNATVGAIVPISVLPPFPTGQMPSPGSPTVGGQTDIWTPPT